jgi:hypothetical protein
MRYNDKTTENGWNTKGNETKVQSYNVIFGFCCKSVFVPNFKELIIETRSEERRHGHGNKRLTLDFCTFIS